MSDNASAGSSIVRASWYGTAVFSATAVAADVAKGLRPVALVVAVTLFAAGCVTFLAAFARAVGRSREESISVAGLFFLSGSAPGSVRRSLLGALAVQVLVGLATAAVRPYTTLAAGTLVPMYGLGLCGLWAARHGSFASR